MTGAALHVIQPGLLMTVQDLGRPSSRRYGVPQGGAMDAMALQAANILLGNRRDAAGLEVTLMGPTLQAIEDLGMAVCGADLGLIVDGAPVPPNSSFLLKAGSQARFGRHVSGVRAYLAIAGGVDVPAVLGSASTYLPANLGGFEGRALRAGDIIRRGILTQPSPRLPLRAALPAAPIDEAVVRVLAGPHAGRFSTDAIEQFYHGVFTVTPRTDRMGCRLDGPDISLPEDLRGGIISEGVPNGTIQVSPDGKPTILLADRPTIGGYAKLATVITVDIPIVGQCGPGTKLRFVPVTLDEAQSLAREAERSLCVIATGVRILSPAL